MSVPVLRKVSYKEKAGLFQSRKMRKGGQATMRWAQQACSDLLPAPAPAPTPAQAGMCGIHWAGVLVQGSKPHIASHTHFSFTFSIVFGYVIVMQQECQLIDLRIAADKVETLQEICSDSQWILERYEFLRVEYKSFILSIKQSICLF